MDDFQSVLRPFGGRQHQVKGQSLDSAVVLSRSVVAAVTLVNRFMRFGGANAAAFDQIQCMLRPVGTFKVSEKDVGVAELRADMKTVAQGAEIDGNGYNPPSLLGLATGAPYFHAGNARTLESALSTIFDKHHNALAANFLQETDPAKRAIVVNQIVHFLLSIDESSAAIAAPATAAGDGGDFALRRRQLLWIAGSSDPSVYTSVISER